MARCLLKTWLSDVLAYYKVIGWDFVQFAGINIGYSYKTCPPTAPGPCKAVSCHYFHFSSGSFFSRMI